jgi:DNA polymerase
MFHVPVEKHGQNADMRQKGKQATLSCSYGGAVGALTAMGALDAGMTEEELPQLVQTWRDANPNIVRLWNALENAAMRCVRKKHATHTHGVTFTYESGFLFMTLPSGRRLAYAKPRIGENRFGSPSLAYEGVGEARKWMRLETFGGKLTENLTQAVARDILCFAMENLTAIRCEIVMHCHDEAIIEAPDTLSL